MIRTKLILLAVLFVFLGTFSLWAQEENLNYSDQMHASYERGKKEICEAHKQIDPSFQEAEHTKIDLPGTDWGQGCLLAVINVTDSFLRGTWRILVAPIPIVQRVQP